MVTAALILDILFDCFFRVVRFDRADVIPVRPELAAPKLLFHFRHLPKDFFGGDAFDGSHNLGRAKQSAHFALKNARGRCQFRLSDDSISQRRLISPHISLSFSSTWAVITALRYARRADRMIKQNTDIVFFVNLFAQRSSIFRSRAAGN